MRYLALGNVAITRMRLGHPGAERLLRLAIALNTRIGRPSSVAEATSSLGVLRRRQGRFAEASEHHRAAMDITDRLADRRLTAHMRLEFGDTLLAAGDPQRAAALFEEAVALARTVTGPAGGGACPDRGWPRRWPTPIRPPPAGTATGARGDVPGR